MSSEPSQHIPPPRVGALLRLAWEKLQADLQQAVIAAGFDDLRPSHARAIRYPPADGLRPSELAASLGLSKQATNDIVRDLEQLGYLTLEPDPNDRRARIIRLTDRGWDFYRLLSRESEAVGRRWTKAIGEERFAEFEATLREIIALDSSDA